MSMGENISVKKRKVIFDEYTGGFYAESKVESIQRQCDYRARLTDVINKAEDAKYKFACKQVEAERQLFLMKKEKAAHRHSEALQEHKAHMNVLEKLASEREQTGLLLDDGNYGRYPSTSLRTNLDELIELELKEMAPAAVRRREANRLLSKRNGQYTIKGNISTDDLFKELKNRKSRAPSPAKTPSPCKTPGLDQPRKIAPKLILPAITVSREGSRPQIQESTKNAKKESKQTTGTNGESQLPSVFVTDLKGNQPIR